MRRYEECAQLDEVAVLGVLHVDHTPRILTATHLFASHLQYGVAADNGERYRRLELTILLLEVVVLIGIALGKLIQLYVIILEILQYALLQLAHLALVQAIRLANDQDNVNLSMQSPYQIQIHLPQAAQKKRIELTRVD